MKLTARVSTKIIHKVVLGASTRGDLLLFVIFLSHILGVSCQYLTAVHIFPYGVESYEVVY